MLINGNCDKNRRNVIIKKCADFLNIKSETGKILVIVQNSYKKNIFLNEIKRLVPDYNAERLKLYTFAGLCYNAFIDNWNFISGLIHSSNSIPNLCGLEISQYIFKKSIKEADFSDYISKVNLLHQLFRRYSLIVQNDLSHEEIIKRSEILNETFYKDAQKAIDNYKLSTIHLNSFDYLRQMAIFEKIYKNTDYFKDIDYLVLDDADECSYIVWKFIDFITPQLKEYVIGYDEKGSSRCGFLCAYKSGVKNFKAKYKCNEIKIQFSGKFNEISEKFYNNIKIGEKTELKDIDLYSTVSRLEMADKVVSEIENLINSGVRANEIAIITPLVDDVLISLFNSKNQKVNFQIISGNEKLTDIPCIKFILSVLKSVNNIELKDYEVKNILINLLKIPLKSSWDIKSEFKDYEFNNSEYNDKYIKFKSTINSLKKGNYGLTEQIEIIYNNIIKEYLNSSEINKYDFLLKEAKSFELAFQENSKDIASEFIIQMENSIISENSADAISIKSDCVIAATPQKLIDINYECKYQFWLDISNSGWTKEDSGTLYNAWVFSRDWQKKEYTLEDNINLTRDKTARIVRKLMLQAEEKIYFYSSLYDNTGAENYCGLNEYIITGDNGKETKFKIIPRTDQKPVLEYENGNMGIMAVPGAGKTTILLALIIKLMTEGVKGENIFVLTYMESAAKNFKEKIKSALPSKLDLPNISTIHGLALRIIKENANYVKAGLDENFQICDDNLKERIIREILLKNKIDEDKFDNYLRCISLIKLSPNKSQISSPYNEINDFLKFYNDYNNTLKANNLIDYDDMLYYAVKILEENPSAAQYYQNICKYIIEDEAQDSTNIQQKLLNILSAKHKNLIRCGDINQAITSTFTNSDTEGFKKFIKNNKKVEMNYSQRCSEPIYKLANKLIQKTSSESVLQSAFYNIEIKGTEKNPKSNLKPQFIQFENEESEKNYILNNIKEIITENPKASIGILLRLNSQVNEYIEMFSNQGIKASVRSDCPGQKRIFKLIFSVLKIIQNPFNNNSIAELAQNYIINNFYKLSANDIEYLRNLKDSFVKLNQDEIKSEGLIQLKWDIDYWINKACSSIDTIALEAGIYYSKTPAEKSNSYIISTYIKRLISGRESFEEVIKILEYTAQKPISTYKFFEDDEDKSHSQVYIMTMHKSKGDEFDYVFIPQMHEDNYPFKKENVKLKSGSHFIQTIKSMTDNLPVKMPDNLKQEQVYETLRLVYVGITRAKIGLYITCSDTYKRNRKIKNNDFLKDLI